MEYFQKMKNFDNSGLTKREYRAGYPWKFFINLGMDFKI